MGKLSRTLSKLKKLKEEKPDRNKISEDSALEQIVEILNYYNIPLERLEDSEKSEAAGESILDALIGFFRRGQLETRVNENGILNIIQTTQSGAKIEYQEVGSRQKKVMDKYGTENYKRLYAFLGSLSGLGSDGIELLKAGGVQNDLACAEILGTLFLLV